jgi:LPS export ABC transporter protein LptC
MIRLSFVLVTLIACSCMKTDFKEPLEYKGPLQEAENVELFNSQNEQIKYKMTAALFYQFENGDKEFPKGIYIEYYNEVGKLKSTIRANYAKYLKKENHWRGEGKVEVKNVETNEQLNTEELYWNPGTQKIHTEKFVTIRMQGDVIYGTGLEANQDLSDYEILHPEGEFEVKE